MTYKILVVDDHPLICNALKHLFNTIVDEYDVITAATAEIGLSIVSTYAEIKLIFVDIGLPGVRGAEAVAAFVKRSPQSQVVAISGSEDRHDITAVLRAGAKAFISKSASPTAFTELVKGILADGPLNARTITSLDNYSSNSDSIGLTRQQQKVLHLLCQSYRNKQIAEVLNIAEITVKTHISSIFLKLNVTCRTEAVLMARQLGFYLDNTFQ